MPHNDSDLARMRWDIFCNVVDNYGDIGVCWRLARQLAGEHRLAVRLWVDDVQSFVRLCPEADARLDMQQCLGVEVRRWAEPFADVVPADVVIDGFGCALPSVYLTAMARQTPRPVWFNLEYLSAEPWVNDCHGLPSPRPEPGLVRYFFFPGFTAGTGGLLREAGLLERRDALRADGAAQTAFWAAFGMPVPQPSALKVSLFCYENDNIPPLLDGWAGGERDVLCMVPEGRVLPQVSAWSGRCLVAGDVYMRGRLEIRVLPFVEQTCYDELLWLCDINVVRGEDSFVRAQWAATPMVWHIYPQDDMAHIGKLSAFLDLYESGLEPADALMLRRFWEAWNHGEGAADIWPAFAAMLGRLSSHAEQWCTALSAGVGGSLSANLVDFSGRIRESSDPNFER
ncbi:MAG: elongation factor P maturation arginine rhamnosyltransferase EarP [Zetaproteobacteria bacterium CG06_land_8_20_14_3_00_59_53]|nr:MAG: hypothetical protein AUK36_04580 [Zetaproteobacteria bacterium CG2_30_59_37]PIO89312.1 MAG: elongation factor P maturation arginine rhamnosyltransferase EarP [Zetaproteobacteria bacterium CG23_combo_of_CG06-09_8_20_14_all_59_86]PIQ65594.1 MAG: elongation factor P maturation arginine rhamnosyltransferase EarP [Zetaproteobacteria bacterium CG11_big_fil_rev_8_21_14_0_20_59_439]PIU70611.1 MAG: elongation factor P maturation arginine rhamnosyltransferase EarP [Zetaproteobacteria bacterium CG0